jgi:Aldos-2-ulose dehydratase/isomerase (AUDH) Cupin domain
MASNVEVEADAEATTITAAAVTHCQTAASAETVTTSIQQSMQVTVTACSRGIRVCLPQLQSESASTPASAARGPGVVAMSPLWWFGELDEKQNIDSSSSCCCSSNASMADEAYYALQICSFTTKWSWNDHMAAHARQTFESNEWELYVKVIRGKLSDSAKEWRTFSGVVYPKAFSKTSIRVPIHTLASGVDIEAGPGDNHEPVVIALLFKRTSKPHVYSRTQVAPRGPGLQSAKWVNCEDYKWSDHFDGLDFYNLRGIELCNHDGSMFSYIQWWLAGPGVNCGDHDHHELTGSSAFCETHVALSAGTGKGGMVFVGDSSKPPSYLPMQDGEEHGPHWQFHSANGQPEKRADGSVVYGSHRWEAGPVSESGPPAYDFWIVFETIPEYSVVSQ